MKSTIIFCFALLANTVFAAPQPTLENKISGPACSLFTYLVTLQSGTLVMCELSETFDSDRATIGKMLSFRVISDVRVNNRVVIRTGAMASGRVKGLTEATYNNPATVTIELTNVQTVDGQFIALNGSEQTLTGVYTGQGMTVYTGTRISAQVTNQTDVHVE
jgi:hypothetical protein